MKQNNYKPKLGQHFLVDENVKNLIINSLHFHQLKNAVLILVYNYFVSFFKTAINAS